LLLKLTAPPRALRRFHWHFFFLGAAFMLLETRSIVTFALLFGTTWMVNSLVFFAVLLSVLAAIAVNARLKGRIGARPLYGALLASLLLAYLLPREMLLGLEPAALRYAVAGFVTFLPVFVANIVFSHSFRDSGEADVAFASNLIGAMVGGMLEYLSLVTGYHALLPVVALCYLLSAVFRPRMRGRLAPA
jgi:hypothetical protein